MLPNERTIWSMLSYLMNCTVNNCFVQDIFESLSREIVSVALFWYLGKCRWIYRELTHGYIKESRLLYNQLDLLYILNQGSYIHNSSMWKPVNFHKSFFFFNYEFHNISHTFNMLIYMNVKYQHVKNIWKTVWTTCDKCCPFHALLCLFN